MVVAVGSARAVERLAVLRQGVGFALVGEVGRAPGTRWRARSCCPASRSAPCRACALTKPSDSPRAERTASRCQVFRFMTSPGYAVWPEHRRCSGRARRERRARKRQRRGRDDDRDRATRRDGERAREKDTDDGGCARRSRRGAEHGVVEDEQLTGGDGGADDEGDREDGADRGHDHDHGARDEGDDRRLRDPRPVAGRAVAELVNSGRTRCAWPRRGITTTAITNIDGGEGDVAPPTVRIDPTRKLSTEIGSDGFADCNSAPRAKPKVKHDTGGDLPPCPRTREIAVMSGTSSTLKTADPSTTLTPRTRLRRRRGRSRG